MRNIFAGKAAKDFHALDDAALTAEMQACDKRAEVAVALANYSLAPFLAFFAAAMVMATLRTVEDRANFLYKTLDPALKLKPARDQADLNGDGQFDWRDWARRLRGVRVIA